MYIDDMMDFMKVIQGNREHEYPAADETRKQHLAIAYQHTEQMTETLRIATRYYLDVRQAEVFHAQKFSVEDFPPLVAPAIYVEFNGRLRFNYSVPYIPDGVAALDDLKDYFMKNDNKYTDYRAVLVYCAHVKLAGTEREEPAVRAYWFEPLRRGENGDVQDEYALSFNKESWPNLLRNKDHLAGESLEHANRLLRMTANLLYFLACENVTFVRVRPEHHRSGVAKGLPKSSVPYHVLPFQVPRYRYKEKEALGKGHAQGHRYDVTGHRRWLRHEKYHRNADGSVRMIWIHAHQRGLAHDVYVPALRVGKVGGPIIDMDQFIRELDAQKSVA